MYAATLCALGGLRMPVALKMLRYGSESLRREARIGGLLRHHNLVDVYEIGEVDGTWFCADVKGHPTFGENLQSQPLSGMLYGYSVTCCMRSALAVKGGAGLGTLGFDEATARKMVGEAGFTRFDTLAIDHPVNAFYQIRP